MDENKNTERKQNTMNDVVNDLMDIFKHIHQESNGRVSMEIVDVTGSNVKISTKLNEQ